MALSGSLFKGTELCITGKWLFCCLFINNLSKDSCSPVETGKQQNWNVFHKEYVHALQTWWATNTLKYYLFKKYYWNSLLFDLLLAWPLHMLFKRNLSISLQSHMKYCNDFLLYIYFVGPWHIMEKFLYGRPVQKVIKENCSYKGIQSPALSRARSTSMAWGKSLGTLERIQQDTRRSFPECFAPLYPRHNVLGPCLTKCYQGRDACSCWRIHGQRDLVSYSP